MPPKEINIPPELTQAIKNDKLIIFVGAGLSYNLKNTQGEALKGWLNLVSKILDNLENKGFDVLHLKGLIGRCEPIKILDLIEDDKSLPKTVIADFVKDFIHLSKDNDFSLHKKIYQLSNKIITTNYDRAFEFAVEQLERNTAYKGKNYELTKHKESHAPLLFKLHGCYYHADSMVLFPTQYEDLYNNPNKDAEHALLVLKNILVNKSVLFIGCGMGDFQINNFFKKIKELQGNYNQKHFIIDTKPLDSSLDFLLRVPIREYSEIPLVIEKLLVEKEKFKQRKTPEVQALEKQLADTKEQLKTLEHVKDDAARKDKLLEREALKYFRRGLIFDLDNNWEKAIKEYKIAIELKPDNRNTLNNLGNALGAFGQTKSDREAEALYLQAIEKFQRVLKVKSNDHQALFGWGTALGSIAKIKSGTEAEVLCYQSIEKYEKAIEIKPDYHEAFYNWGNDLETLAKTKLGGEAETLYRQAIEKIKKAVEIKPDFHEAFFNWGYNLMKVAETKLDKEAELLRYQSIEKYEKAIEIKPDYHEAFYNWGNTLIDLAKTKSGTEVEILYHQAIEKYQQAIEIKPDKYEAFHNMGNAFGDIAKIKSGTEAENLYRQSFEKYQKAIGIKPDYHEVFNSWGVHLNNLAKTKSAKEAKTLEKEALKKLQKGVDLGGEKYNLACAYALLSDKENALLYLEQSLENKEDTTDFILQDEDWKPYLNDKDFQKIIKKYENK